MKTPVSRSPYRVIATAVTLVGVSSLLVLEGAVAHAAPAPRGTVNLGIGSALRIGAPPHVPKLVNSAPKAHPEPPGDRIGAGMRARR